MRRLLVGVMVIVVGLVASARRAGADDATWRAFRGKVIFTDVALAPAANFGSAATMTTALRRIERSGIDQTAGFWRMHIVAFLDHPAATDVLVMRALDTSAPREARANQPRQVRVFEVPVERGANEVRLDDFVITDGMGFERGVTYEMSLEAPPEEGSSTAATKARKADVYAKGVITLR